MFECMVWTINLQSLNSKAQSEQVGKTDQDCTVHAQSDTKRLEKSFLLVLVILIDNDCPIAETELCHRLRP